MPAFEAGAAQPVSVDTTGGKRQAGAAIPVYVASGGPRIAGPARRVVVVTSGPIEDRAAVPVYEAAASGAVEAGPALPVFVVQGSLGNVVSPMPPANTVLPVISGTAAPGQTLSTTNGTWTNTPTSYAYQWKRDGVAIGGATSNTYLLTASDAGTTTTVTVTATNADGSASATSAGVAISSLHTSLVAYYALEDTTGADATGRGNTLTATNSPTTTTGKVGNAAQLTAASNQYYTRADNADLSMGDIDFTIAVWAYLDSKGADRMVVSKFTPGGNQREYQIDFNNAADRLRFVVSNDGAASVVATASALGSPSLATWYLIVAWHDAAANTINIQINDGTVNSTAHTTGVLNGTSPFRIGMRGDTTLPMNGRIDEVGVWKRVLTTAERTTLYNGGNGRTYPF